MQQAQKSPCGQYTIESTIQKVFQGLVKLAVDQNGNRVLLIFSSAEALQREYNILTQLNHPNIIKAIEYNDSMEYQNKFGVILQKSCLVLEYTQREICLDIQWNESSAKKQLIEALQYITQQGFCHRDLKPENLYLDHNFNIKINSFSLAAKLDKYGSRQLKTRCGTLGYMAPELFTSDLQTYDGEKSDIFTLGIILFIFVYGRPPFREAKMSDPYFKLIAQNNWDQFWHIQKLKHNLTPELRELFLNVWELDPQLRWNYQQLQESKWMQGPTATIQQIQDEFLDRYLKKEQANVKLNSLQNESNRVNEKLPNYGQIPIDLNHQLMIDFLHYKDIFTQIDQKYNITAGDRKIQSVYKLPRDIINKSWVQKDLLFALLINYASTNQQYQGNLYELQIFHVFKVNIKQTIIIQQFEFLVNSQSDGIIVQIELGQLEDNAISIIYIRIQGETLIYAKVQMALQQFASKIQDPIDKRADQYL